MIHFTDVNFTKKLKSQTRSLNRAEVTIQETRRIVQVIYRCYPLKEGWWIKEFEKTPTGRSEAYILFSDSL